MLHCKQMLELVLTIQLLSKSVVFSHFQDFPKTLKISRCTSSQRGTNQYTVSLYSRSIFHKLTQKSHDTAAFHSFNGSNIAVVKSAAI